MFTKQQIDENRGLSGIYFIQDSYGYIRIGIDGDFPNRLGTHQSSNSQELKLLAFIPLHRRRYKVAETELFSKYTHLKHRGSFYKPEILESLQEIKEFLKPFEIDPESNLIPSEEIILNKKNVIKKVERSPKEKQEQYALERRAREAEYEAIKSKPHDHHAGRRARTREMILQFGSSGMPSPKVWHNDHGYTPYTNGRINIQIPYGEMIPNGFRTGMTQKRTNRYTKYIRTVAIKKLLP